MVKNNRRALSNSIITLAQNETKDHIACVVSGKGTDISKTNLKFRASRKQYNQTIALALADLAKQQGDTIKQRRNWNTYYCQNIVTTSKGRLYSKYCKNRNCENCQDIKRAKIINKYLPIIKTWTQPHLITLTVKACAEHELESTIQKMFYVFKRIKDKHRKRSLRGKGFEFLGVKSLECEFDLERELYKPHFHLIVENKHIGDSLISEWLEIWTMNHVEQIAQNIKCIKNTEQDLINTLKYISKPNINMQEIGNTIYISALDNIYDAIKGKRIFDRFGFNVPKTERSLTTKEIILNDYEKWVYNVKIMDWENSNGIILSDL